VLTPVAAIGSWLRRLGVPAPLDRERLRKLLEGPVIDTTVARSELGFRDVTDMDAGLAEEVRWYRGRQ
jgi:nucleoside-diphosphate-sugar epimerase